MAAKVTRKRDHPLYPTWNNIRQRTTNTKHSAYHNYGGRGICMYGGWINNFGAFAADVDRHLGDRPHKHTLDRRDNDGNYVIDNLRWATAVEQATNRRSSIHLTYQGETKPLVAWAACTGIGMSTLFNRYQLGWSTEEILMTPMNAKVKPRRAITFDGRTQGLCAWARELGISHKSLSGRFDRGWSLEEAMSRV